MATLTRAKAHERLAAALCDLVRQADIADYRDSLGHPAPGNLAYAKAQDVVDTFGLSHARLCATLDHFDWQGDMTEAAKSLWSEREGR